MSEETLELIEAARLYEFSAAEKEEHRRSFAFGNTKIENSRITRELIDREAERLDRERAERAHPRVADESIDNTRHSQALEAELIQDPDEKAAAEGRNGLRQIDKVVEVVEYYVQNKLPFKLRPSLLTTLHRVALEGISSYAGLTRPASIEIGGSKHQPVGAYLVAEQVEEMCDYVNEHWQSQSAIHLAAYVLWRLNWIHPFTDGNGRTARAASYLVLCLRLGYPLYAPESVPAQIAQNKKPYYVALEAADAAWEQGIVDVSELEKLLDALLARQLLGIMTDARGGGAGGSGSE